MKEQTMLDLKSSSLIWEYWETNILLMTVFKVPVSPPPPKKPTKKKDSRVTFPSTWESLNTWVKVVMCSFLIRSLLRTSMAWRILLFTSRVPERWAAILLGSWVSEPLVKVARICEPTKNTTKGQRLLKFNQKSTNGLWICLLHSQNSFLGCLQMAAQHSTLLSRHNWGALL